MKNIKPMCWMGLCVVWVGAAVQTKASLLAYDGFLAGGASPNGAAGEYQTGTGYTGDFLDQQGPTALGFSSSAWAQTNSAYAATVYYRTEGAQQVYADSQNRQLQTTPGQLNLFRSSGNSPTNKEIYRDLDVGNSLPDALYLSFLVQVSSGDLFALRSASTDGNESRRFNVGINAAGNPYVTGTLSGTPTTGINTGMVLDPNVAHFLVLRMSNGGSTNDGLELYVDPFLDSEGLNTPVASVFTGNFYVGNNASWTLQDIFFRNQVIDAPSSVIVDELRLGTTWEDVTPHQVVPEPGSGILLLMGVSILCFRSRVRRVS